MDGLVYVAGEPRFLLADGKWELTGPAALEAERLYPLAQRAVTDDAAYGELATAATSPDQSSAVHIAATALLEWVREQRQAAGLALPAGITAPTLRQFTAGDPFPAAAPVATSPPPAAPVSSTPLPPALAPAAAPLAFVPAAPDAPAESSPGDGGGPVQGPAPGSLYESPPDATAAPAPAAEPPLSPVLFLLGALALLVLGRFLLERRKG